MSLSKENQQWLEDTWERFQKKLSAERDRIFDKIPYIPVNGKYTDYSTYEHVNWWTNGFWVGMMWQMYHATGDEKYKEAAEACEEKLAGPLEEAVRTHHDVGFMFLHSAVANYKLTGNTKSMNRGLHAANLLAGRYNPDGQFIRAWNQKERAGWVIVDCMMNIPLLYWASDILEDPRYKMVAMHHADTCLREVLRPDGSSYHIVAFDTVTGEVVGYPDCQGYAPEGAWSRGQAWAIYGYALSYHHTHEQRYLDAAKKVAHYFMANCAQTGNIPLIDFRAPAEPVHYDSTAAMCAVCGMLEIAQSVPEFEKGLYENAAVSILKATADRFCNWKEEEDGILGGGSVAYHRAPEEIEVPIIYGDYFMLEAVLRLLKKDFMIW